MLSSHTSQKHNLQFQTKKKQREIQTPPPPKKKKKKTIFLLYFFLSKTLTFKLIVFFPDNGSYVNMNEREMFD